MNNSGEFSQQQEFIKPVEINTEQLLDGRHTIMIIKPSGHKIEVECPALANKYQLQEVLKSIFQAIDLQIIAEGQKQITEEQVRKIYPILDAPSEFGEDWKIDVIGHMTSEPIGYYILEGDNADEKTQNLKRSVRNKWLDRSSVQSYVVENLIHVADQEDLATAYKVLTEK